MQQLYVSVVSVILVDVSFLTCDKRFVVGGLHEFEDVIAGVVVFVVDLGVAKESGVSPFFKDCSGYV